MESPSKQMSQCVLHPDEVATSDAQGIPVCSGCWHQYNDERRMSDGQSQRRPFLERLIKVNAERTTKRQSYSNSQLQSMKNCPLQFHFYWDLALRRIDDEGSDHHLRYGSAFHQGLAVLYQGGSLNESQWAFRNAYPTQLDLNDKAKTQEHGVIALAAYARRWAEEDRKWKVIVVETRSDDPWSVKPDLIIENLDHGGVYLVDHKTTGKYLNYDYWAQFEPNSQITHYLDYAQSKYGEIEGFIINAIGFRFRERAYKGEPAGFWSNFERQTFNRRPEQLEHERRNRAWWIETIESCRRNGFWPTNTSSCKFCQYKAICAPGWSWENDRELIEIQYRQVCDALLTYDERCVLDRNHEGEHAPVLPIEQLMEISVEC
jgi:hypothetical protein